MTQEDRRPQSAAAAPRSRSRATWTAWSGFSRFRYLDRFAHVHADLDMPAAEILAPGTAPPTEIHGVRVTLELHFRMRRLTKTNKIRVGGGTLRYAKGKPLLEAVGQWQSAFILGYLSQSAMEDGAEPERQLCLTVDAYSVTVHSAPTDSIRRHQDMTAACQTIAEWWPNITPPPNCVL